MKKHYILPIFLYLMQLFLQQVCPFIDPSMLYELLVSPAIPNTCLAVVRACCNCSSIS